MVIAIDGPAGSGKGTVTGIIAEKLNLVTIDTGATYRCVALECLNRGIGVEETDKVIQVASEVDIKFDEDKHVFLNDVDVTHEIRTTKVNNIVSPVSAIPKVREYMVALQRKMAEGKNVIMEGRDITTVVFPNAEYKFYLDASAEERAKRRLKQNLENGIESTYEEVLESIQKRDYGDMHKEVGSLMRTPEQIYIDSTNLTIDEVVQEIIKHIEV